MRKDTQVIYSIYSRFSSQSAASCVSSELLLVFRRPINLNARSSKGERARPFACSRQFLILHGTPLSFLLSPYRNELPCTNVAYFLGAAIRFHRAATSRTANYGANWAWCVRSRKTWLDIARGSKVECIRALASLTCNFIDSKSIAEFFSGAA